MLEKPRKKRDLLVYFLQVWSGNIGSKHSCYDLKNSRPEAERERAVSITSNSKHVAVGYREGTVGLFEIGGFREVKAWKAHTTSVNSLSFIKAGHTDHLITASDDNSLKRWEHNYSKPKLLVTMNGHSGIVKCVRARESLIVSGSEDTTVCVWPGIYFPPDCDSAQCKDVHDVVRPTNVFKKHTGVVTSCDLSNEEDLIISTSIDKVTYW